MTSKLSLREQEVFDWILAYVSQHIVTPTTREIADGFNVKMQSAVNMCKNLVIKGRLLPMDWYSGRVRIKKGPTNQDLLDFVTETKQSLQGYRGRVVSAHKETREKIEAAILVICVRAQVILDTAKLDGREDGQKSD